MLQIDIKPLSGITIHKKGEVHLGQVRREVEHLIGFPDKTDTVSTGKLQVQRAFYHRYEFRIDYDNNNLVEFIEFIYGPRPEKTELTVYGINPFEVEANKLVEFLSVFNSGEIDETEAPYCYAFKNISVGVWRDSSPAAVQEFINEKRTNNRNESDESWLDEELKKANYFWTFGIGRKNYYDY